MGHLPPLFSPQVFDLEQRLFVCLFVCCLLTLLQERFCFAEASTPVVGFITQHFFHYIRRVTCVSKHVSVMFSAVFQRVPWFACIALPPRMSHVDYVLLFLLPSVSFISNSVVICAHT